MTSKEPHHTPLERYTLLQIVLSAPLHPLSGKSQTLSDLLTMIGISFAVEIYVVVWSTSLFILLAVVCGNKNISNARQKVTHMRSATFACFG